MALTAHALAVRTGKGVVHFFAPGTSEKDDPIAPEETEVVRDILDIDAVRRFQSGGISASGIYADDGHVAVASSVPEPNVNGSAPQNPNGLQPPASALASKVVSAGTSAKTSQASESGDSDATASVATTVETAPPQITSADIYDTATRIWTQLKNATGRDYSAFEVSGPADATNALFIFGSDAGSFAEVLDNAKPDDIFAKAAIITPRLYRPWIGSKLVQAIPSGIKRIAVLEQIHRKTTKWGPLLIDVLTSTKSGPGGVEHIVGYQLGYVDPKVITQALRGIVQNLTSDKPIQNLEIGVRDGPEEQSDYTIQAPQLETAYDKILDQLFGKRRYVANALKSSNAGISSTVAASPEFGFGSLLARKDLRTRFIKEAKEAASSKEFITEGPKSWLAKWALNAEDPVKATEVADDVIARLETDGSPLAQKLLKNKSLFRKESLWLTGSDAWVISSVAV